MNFSELLEKFEKLNAEISESAESFGGLNGSLSKERPKENSFENPAPENSFAERWLWKWHLMMQTRVPVLKRREECEMQHGNLVHHRFLEIMELRLMALMVGKLAMMVDMMLSPDKPSSSNFEDKR